MSRSEQRTGGSPVLRITKKVLRVSFAAVLLYYVFSYIGVQTVIGAINKADPAALYLAFVAAVAVQVVCSYRLKGLTDIQGLHLSTLLVFEVNLATRFYGLFVPGGNITALLIRIFKLARERSQMASVVVSLFVDRLMATLSLCILGLVFWVFAHPRSDELWLLVFALATTTCLVPTGLIFAQSALPGFEWLASILRGLNPGSWDKLTNACLRCRGASRKTLVYSLILSVAAHLVGAFGYWLVGQSLDMALSLPVMAWVRSGMLLVTLLPVTIAGLGLREIAALVLLGQYGVEADIAVAFSMLVFGTTVLGVAMLGGLTEAWRFVYSRER